MKKNKRNIVILTVVCLIVGIVLFKVLNNRVDRDVLTENIQKINDECNNVFKDIEGSEEKYLKLLETQTDPFERGLSYSALVQIYTYHQDFDKVMEYGEYAVENYNKVEFGEYYSIMEKEYLAWSMLNMKRYPESFEVATELLEMVNLDGGKILNDEERDRSKQLVYSIYIRIYTQFDVLDKAEYYYNELCKMDTENNYKSINSKVEYVKKIGEIELEIKYAKEYYNIIKEMDEKTGNNVSDSALLYLGDANVRAGNLEEGFTQIERAEKFYVQSNNRSSLAESFKAKANYYSAINDIEKAKDYYKKSFEILEEIQSYERYKVYLEDYRVFLQKNNLEYDIKKYYEIYTRIDRASENKQIINDLLSQIVTINDELNEGKILLLQAMLNKSRMATIGVLAMVIVLVIMLIWMIHLVKEKNKAKNHVEEMLNKDYLTGVYTRSYGERMTISEMNLSREISLAIIDIDDFKKINDRYGHDLGDIVLKVFTEEVKKNLQEKDILYRFGGEEFIIVFFDKSIEECKEILDRARLGVYNIIFDNDVRITFSGGLSRWKGTVLNDLIKESDILLYKAKHEGKNRILI